MGKLINILDALMGLCSGWSFAITGMVYAQLDTQGLTTALLGPLGALALSLIACYLLYKYAKSQRDKYDALQSKLMDEKERRLQKLEEENERLKRDRK